MTGQSELPEETSQLVLCLTNKLRYGSNARVILLRFSECYRETSEYSAWYVRGFVRFLCFMTSSVTGVSNCSENTYFQVVVKSEYCKFLHRCAVYDSIRFR